VREVVGEVETRECFVGWAKNRVGSSDVDWFFRLGL